MTQRYLRPSRMRFMKSAESFFTWAICSSAGVDGLDFLAEDFLTAVLGFLAAGLGGSSP